MVRVVVSYRVGGQFEFEENLRTLAKKYRGKLEQPRDDFGQRDLKFSFAKAKYAKGFRERTKEIIGENGTVSSLIFRVSAHELLEEARRRVWE